jgi:hypothetical protein
MGSKILTRDEFKLDYTETLLLLGDTSQGTLTNMVRDNYMSNRKLLHWATELYNEFGG